MAILQLLITYASSLPASETWLSMVYPKFLSNSSMIGLSELGKLTLKCRAHLCVLSLAIFVSEAFAVAQSIDNYKEANKIG